MGLEWFPGQGEKWGVGAVKRLFFHGFRLDSVSFFFVRFFLEKNCSFLRKFSKEIFKELPRDEP